MKAATMVILLLLSSSLFVYTQTPGQPQNTPMQNEVTKALTELRKEVQETKVEVMELRETRAQKQVQKQVQRHEREASVQRDRLKRIDDKREAERAQVQKEISEAERGAAAARARLLELRNDQLLEQTIDMRLAELDNDRVRTSEEEHKVFTAVVVDRARLLEKIKKNNRTFRCRVLHIGCIKLK